MSAPSPKPPKRKPPRRLFEEALTDLTQGNEKLQNTVKQLRTSTVSYCALSLNEGLNQIERALDNLGSLSFPGDAG